jgi:two-component system cell cycle sensor histidine kinase/response regulator CckA
MTSHGKTGPASHSVEALLDAFFTDAPAGLAILDAELRYVRLNQTLASMNGRSIAQHIGKRVGEVLPTLTPAVEPILTQILATGTPALNVEHTGETPAEPGVRRAWLASYFPVPGAGGKPTAIGAIVVGDTRRAQLERAQRSGEESRAVAEDATHGLYHSSVDGAFTSVNPALARMLGYDAPQDLLDLDVARDVYADPAEHDRLTAKYRLAEAISGVEAVWKRKDGHEILVRLSGRPLRDADWAIIGFSMIAEDITEQRAAERALQQAQKMQAIGELTAGIAHDFNNLLTVILSQASFLNDGLPPDRADLRADLVALEGAAKRGADLVRKLLGFSRHERLVPVALDLNAWVRDALQLVGRLLPPTVGVRLDPDTEVALVEADARALEHVLLNLATNARDAMPSGGTLHIGVSSVRLLEEDRPLHAWIRPGAFGCLTVSDTGTGMDKETLARALDPFFTTKPAGVGTGLGLSMVYGLVKQHNGFVHLYSQVGQGTTVKVYLPLATGPAAPAPRDQEAGALPGGPERILLVEDDIRLRRVAERLLRKVGYAVMSAADGAEGLELYHARRREIDLVMTDLAMPKLSGDELYKRLRDEEPGLKILFITGHPEPRLREWTGDDPAVGFVMKPWTAAELLTGVRVLLGEPSRSP